MLLSLLLLHLKFKLNYCGVLHTYNPLHINAFLFAHIAIISYKQTYKDTFFFYYTKKFTLFSKRQKTNFIVLNANVVM